MGGRYEELEAREGSTGAFEEYSAALNLILRMEDGILRLYDPDTGEHMPTFQSERARAESAEARTQELEAEIRRLRAGGTAADAPEP